MIIQVLLWFTHGPRWLATFLWGAVAGQSGTMFVDYLTRKAFTS